MPGSATGIVFLCALVPGYIYLRMTSRRRRAMHNPSTLDEIITLVASGLLISGPFIFVTSFVAADAVARVWSASANPADVTADDVRAALLLTLTISALSTGTAVLWALDFNRRNEVQAGDSVWHDTIGTKVSEHGTHADVEMSDGRIVSGLVDNYDGVPAGIGRDLALSGKMFCMTKGGQSVELPATYLVIPESEIVSILVRHVSDPGRISQSE